MNLAAMAATLETPWRSLVLARFGDANVKLLRMDGQPHPEEMHDHAEGLLVLEGELRLLVDGGTLTVHAGELHVMPAGTVHAVAAGSDGTLLILDT